jgi:glutaryl-CoA dehydrogenase
VAQSPAGSKLHSSLDPVDLFDVRSALSEEERMVQDSVARLVDERVLPIIQQCFEEHRFPRELVPELAALGLLGSSIEGYGCAGLNGIAYGLICQQLERGDSGIRSFVSVQSSLCMYPIHAFGSEAQKQRYLPRMAKGELIGCFGLTEPTAGSDPASMLTTARRQGDGWVLDGQKRWIGLASVADVAVIWAKTEDGAIRGFVVPTTTPGFTATPIEQKLSMRASIQCDVDLVDVRLPADAVLPDVTGLKGPFSCLNEARYGIMWGAMGAARDAYEAARDYALERTQFGRPLASFQLTQQKLVDMVLEIQKGVLVAVHTGRLKDAGRLRPEQISFGKLNNVREAIRICRQARTVIGGNGVTLDHSPLRHANNLESVRTYEGTDEVHTLIMGRAVTGIPAFG